MGGWVNKIAWAPHPPVFLCHSTWALTHKFEGQKQKVSTLYNQQQSNAHFFILLESLMILSLSKYGFVHEDGHKRPADPNTIQQLCVSILL